MFYWSIIQTLIRMLTRLLSVRKLSVWKLSVRKLSIQTLILLPAVLIFNIGHRRKLLNKLPSIHISKLSSQQQCAHTYKAVGS